MIIHSRSFHNCRYIHRRLKSELDAGIKTKAKPYWRIILKFSMPLYEAKYHDKTEWVEISEIELMDGLYKIYKKITPAIKKMIIGKEVETPDAVYRLKDQYKSEFSV